LGGEAGDSDAQIGRQLERIYAPMQVEVQPFHPGLGSVF